MLYIHNYIWIYSPKTAVPAHSATLSRPESAYFAGDSPAFQQYHAEKIGYTTPIVFNWVYRTVYIPWLLSSYDTHKANVGWIQPKPQGEIFANLDTLSLINAVGLGTLGLIKAVGLIKLFPD